MSPLALTNAMQSIQRTAVRSLRRLRPQSQRQPRRHASDSHGYHGSHDAHHAQHTNESFGAGFYIAVAALPLSFAVYKYTQQGETPYFTRLITDTYARYKIKWAQRNDLHTQMIEQAASDKVLFLNESNQSIRHVDLRFPEQFNNGAPWNVPAGQGHANIDDLIAKYHKENQAAQEKRLQQLRDNDVPRERPVEHLTKSSPGAGGG